MTGDIIERVAEKLHAAEMGANPSRWVAWDELDDDERGDLRHLVRSVLAIVANDPVPAVAGLLGLPPPLDTAPAPWEAASPDAASTRRPGDGPPAPALCTIVASEPRRAHSA